MGTQLRKRKKTYDPLPLITTEKIDVSEMSVDGKGDHIICGKCVGIHGYAYYKFKCLNCGKRGMSSETAPIYICFKALEQSWKRDFRRVISLDGSFLKEKYLLP